MRKARLIYLTEEEEKMTEKDLDEFEKEFGFKLLPTSFKKPLSEITKQEMDEFIFNEYKKAVKEKELQ